MAKILQTDCNVDDFETFVNNTNDALASVDIGEGLSGDGNTLTPIINTKPVPDGGTSNQVLTKPDSGNQSGDWQDPQGVQESPVNGLRYGRKDSDWEQSAIQTDAPDTVAKVRTQSNWVDNSGDNTKFDNSNAALPNNPSNTQAAINELKSYVDSTITGQSRYLGVAEDGTDIRTFIPMLRGDYFVVPKDVTLTFSDGAGGIDNQLFIIGGSLFINVDMSVTNDVIFTGFIFDESSLIAEAPSDGKDYSRKDETWNAISNETILIPFDDAGIASIKFDRTFGDYQHGATDGPNNVLEYAFDTLNAKLGATFSLVTDVATKPTFGGGAILEVQEIGGSFKLGGVVNVIRGQFIGGNTVQISYDNEGVIDPSAKIKTVPANPYTLLQSDNGFTILLTNQGATTVNLPNGLTLGHQASFINKTNDVVTFAGSISAEGLLLETPETAALSINLGTDTYQLIGKLTA